VLATFAYDDLGRRTSLTRGNGTSTSYGFDAVSRLTSLTDNPAGTTYDQTLGFSYNPASQIVQQTRSNDLFAWAGHGNGTTSSTANGLNQVTVHGGTSTSHDARGNMTVDGLGRSSIRSTRPAGESRRRPAAARKCIASSMVPCMQPEQFVVCADRRWILLFRQI
jgi:YD repeat-containing protein